MARLSVRCSTLRLARQQIATRARSATDVTQAYLKGLRAVEPAVQNFLAIDEEAALAQVAEVERRLAAGEDLPLAGVPIAIKVPWHGAVAGTAATREGATACCSTSAVAEAAAARCMLPPAIVHAPVADTLPRADPALPAAPQDNLCTQGLETTAGSKQLAGYLPPYDATAVARLRAAGAVLVGKTNMDEVR